ncbi:helix-turn-helix transcriptional regulator [Streptomyces fractus]|uniref:helix-turn-helix transcriptional regulator n=1 Tax=Streptomyces fractus TaxID=641806 RepID=UPI003CE9C7AD
MKHDPAAWQRLSEMIRAHRGRKGWSQAELAQHAGISTKSALTAESGKPPTRMPPSLDRIARALGWADGSVNAILEGGDPLPSQAAAESNQGFTPSRPDTTGRAVAALRQATEFSRICAEMGADAASLAAFDAAAEALLSSAVTAQARAAGLGQDHFAAVAHSPRSDGGPDTDRAVVDDVVRRFRAEQHTD